MRIITTCSSLLFYPFFVIGVGMVLVTISGVAWKVTSSESSTCLGMETSTEYEHCGRQQCMRNNGIAHGLLYPEFQHRAPPPSYQVMRKSIYGKEKS
jgi:hypothetical protein